MYVPFLLYDVKISAKLGFITLAGVNRYKEKKISSSWLNIVRQKKQIGPRYKDLKKKGTEIRIQSTLR